MIRFIAVATARDLHEAKLACTVHAHENLHREDSLQEPRPWVPRCLLFSVIFLDTLRPLLAEELALRVVVRHTVPLKLFRATWHHLRTPCTKQ